MRKLLLMLIGMSYFASWATDCPSAIPIPASPAFPYSQSLTCGATNDITAANAVACGSNFYYGGQEALYVWTPTENYANVSIDYAGQSWSGIFLFAGCPTSGGSCIGNITSSGSTKTLNVTSLTAGVTYYLMFDTWPTPNSPCPGTFTINGTMVPPPPTPTQDPTIPTCATGSSIDLAGPAPTGFTWYWQTSASGTSTANPYAGPLAISSNGVYYARTQHNASGVWSATSSSITVSNFPTATAPPTPVAAANPACLSTTVSVAAAPAGYEYYWQTVNLGTSSANNASTPLTVSSTGTYYVAAYETATQCWSITPSVAVTIGTFTPDAPVTSNNNINACVGAGSIMLDATAAATSGTATVVFANNYSLTQGTTAALNGTLTIPAGATITSSQLSFIGVSTLSGSWPSDIDINMTGASTLGTVDMAPVTGSVTNAGPYNHTPSTSGSGAVTLNLNHTYSFGGPATFDQIVLTVTYNVPPSAISWYDAATAGNVIGSGSPFEAVGTTVLPNTSTEGSYSFFAASDADGCVSPTTEIVVNITPVLAELLPVDVTCNGGSNGSFSVGTVDCGTPPFSYSVDGGAFSTTIPTNLVAGTYAVVIQDAGMEQSAPITVIVSEPGAPINLMVTDINYFSADVTWTPQGDESTWTVEYGPAGFVLGTGMTVSASTNSATLTGLTEDTDYEFYVVADCGGATADTAGAVAFTTNAGFFTYDTDCGPGFIDISATGTPLNLADDATALVTSGFPLSLQGQSSDQITISNNGWISFGATVFLNAWNLDLDSEEGNVYYETVNVGGDNLFIVQWQDRPRFPGIVGQSVTFQLIVNETTGEIYYIYEDVVFGGTQASNDYGAQGTISVDGPITDVTVSSFSSTFLTNNTCAHFYNALCPNPVNISATVLQEQIDLDWDAGLYGETTWTVIYGEEGFDPTTQGVTIGGLSSSDASISGLDQLTTYDFYIYSECQADNLTSPGLMVTYTTLPWCAAPTSLAGMTDIDSLELTWNWTETDPMYPVQSFNIQYMMSGNDLYSANATEVMANGINFSDTVVDATLLGGGVYEVYVQATCTTGDTSNFAGPITLVMPLTNDIVCDAVPLMVDGTEYVFNNAGATVSTDESTIAPPVTGAQTTDGWGNGTLNGTTWFTFVAPASGSVRVNNTAVSYNGQAAVYSTTDCNAFAAFSLVNANDDEIGGTSVAPNFTVCGLTPGSTYYLMHDGFNATTGNYGIAITPIVLEAGSAASVVDVCSGDNVDLFTTLTGNDAGGVWTSDVPSVNIGINGSDFESAGLGYQVYEFQYRVTDGCAYDSIITEVHIYGPSNAGEDGIINVCQNHPVNLLSGLTGNVDLGGTWYDPSDVALASGAIVTGQLPGQFNYDYITSNGVCPADTSNVIVNVSPTCDWAGIEEQVFGGISLYPNPSNGLVYVTSESSSEFEYVVTDARGSIIRTGGVIKATQTTEINLNDVITGVYFVRLFNDEAEKVYRVVIQ